MSSLQSCDHAKAEAFQARFSDMLMAGALNNCVAVGHELGLFVHMRELNRKRPRWRSQDLAEISSLSERYLREWLGVMACGNFVELVTTYSLEEQYFSFPPEHWGVLCADVPGNLAAYSTEMPLLTTSVYNRMPKLFKTGEGTSYGDYPGFNSFMEKLAVAKHNSSLLGFVKSNPDLHTKLLHGDMRVLDVGCGSGVATRLMAQQYPKSQFVGIDIDERAIEVANSASRRDELSNIEFVTKDALTLIDGTLGDFDYATAFDAIHDLNHPETVVKGVVSVLKKRGGIFSAVDVRAKSDIAGNVGSTMGGFAYAVSLFYCMPVGLGVDGKGKGFGMMWGETRAVELFSECGFADVEILEIQDDPFNVEYRCHVNPKVNNDDY
eukprot:CFRG4816T1